MVPKPRDCVCMHAHAHAHAFLTHTHAHWGARAKPKPKQGESTATDAERRKREGRRCRRADEERREWSGGNDSGDAVLVLSVYLHWSVDERRPGEVRQVR